MRFSTFDAWIAGASLLCLTGCSDPAQPAADAGNDTGFADVSSDVPTSDVPQADTGAPVDVVTADTPARDVPSDSPADAPATDCPADRLCLRTVPVETGGTIAAGRLAVVWFQLNDDGPDPAPQVAYDVPFEGGARRLEIPRAMVTAPADPVLLCQRACDDEATCPCTGDVRVGIGIVVLGQDRNGNGRLDFSNTSSDSEPLYGASYMTVGWSVHAVTSPPAPYNQLYPEGIQQGLAPYRIIPRDPTFDRQGIPAPGQVFDLFVCPWPASGSCNPMRLNLT